MKSSQNIVLVGFSGTGKSTVGRALALRLRRPFVDTDSLVERTAGMTIPEIFSSMGEPRFREMEEAAVRSAAALRGVVIAVGGGALENGESRHSLKHSPNGRSTVVLLKAGIDTMMKRVRGSEERPLMSGCDPLDMPSKTVALLQRRMPAYLEMADMVVESERPVEEVVSELLARLPGGPGRSACPPAELRRERGIPPIECVSVEAQGGRYDVRIGRDLTRDIPRWLTDSCGGPDRVFVVSNPLVSHLWMDGIRTSLEGAGLEVDCALVGDGEQHKNLDTVSRLYDRLAANHHDRDTVVVALGGGVVGDTAGFVAATFMRGLPLVHVPTTLLAQVDSSVGGKTAVNHSEGKNLIGAFNQPRLVVSDIDVLRTLPDPVFSEGMAEVIKTAVIGGEALFGLVAGRAAEIASRHPAALQSIVAGCVRVKAGVVSEDERDTGRRLLLNLGHTFGHALEAACGYGGASHGEAVAVGTCMAAELSSALGLAVPGLHERVSGLIRRFGLPARASDLGVVPAPEKVEEYLLSDKKRLRGKPRFVLPVGIGDVRVVGDVPHTLVRDVIRRGLDG